MTWILRMALTSAALYVVLVFFVDRALLLTARYKGSAGIYMSRPSWFVFFAASWTVSFWLAYWISPLRK